jgi:hypothetical protein
LTSLDYLTSGWSAHQRIAHGHRVSQEVLQRVGVAHGGCISVRSEIAERFEAGPCRIRCPVVDSHFFDQRRYLTAAREIEEIAPVLDVRERAPSPASR